MKEGSDQLASVQEARPAEVELVPLAVMVLRLRPGPSLDDTPSGSRLVVEAESGRLEGEQLCGSVVGHASADWFIVGPHRIGTIDARLLVETDDGATIFMHYGGRVDLGAKGAPVYIAPRFETGHARYRWLNSTQAVGRGVFSDQSTLVYDLFAVR